MNRTLLFFLLGSCSTASAAADVIFSDNFSYPDGNLTEDSPWSAFAGDSNAIQVVSGRALISHGSGSREDVSRSFAAVTSGSIFAGFDFSVEDLGSPYSGTNNQYFAQFNQSGARARMDIVSAGAGGDFSVGIATNSATADATWSSDLTFNTIYRAVLEFDIDRDQAKLWINPTGELSTSILGADLSAATSIEAFAFRQADSTEDETISVDNLIVATSFNEAFGSPAAVPEPSAVWLLLAAGVAGVSAHRIRQRRREPSGTISSSDADCSRDC